MAADQVGTQDSIDSVAHPLTHRCPEARHARDCTRSRRGACGVSDWRGRAVRCKPFSPMNAVARYFPVADGPLRVQPSLARFGTDFGNGFADSQAFQRDECTPDYLEQKASVVARSDFRAGIERTPAAEVGVTGVLEWMRARLRTEHGVVVDADDDPAAIADALALALPEDFVILTRGPSGERCSLVHVCFPSNWQPERVFGLGFAALHAPVPGFAELGATIPKLVSAIFERGPYVRFVWTVCPDQQLDHHPDRVKPPWPAVDGRSYLRVERQSLFPFPELHACLFLIRTYLYEFTQLTPSERSTLHAALTQMPPEMLRYKGLDSALPEILRALAVS